MSRLTNTSLLMSYRQWDSLSREEKVARWEESPYRASGAKHPDLYLLPDPPLPMHPVHTGVNAMGRRTFEEVSLIGKSFDPRDSRYAKLHAYGKACIARHENMGGQIAALEAHARTRRAWGDPEYTPPPIPGGRPQ